MSAACFSARPSARDSARTSCPIEEVAPPPADLADPIERYSAANSVVETVGPSSVNLFKRSENLEEFDLSSAVTVTGRADISFGGRPTATLVEPSATTSRITFQQAIPRTPNSEQTISFRAKAGPGHNGTDRFNVWAFTGQFTSLAPFQNGIIPTAGWTRYEFTIPDTDPNTVISGIDFYPAEVGGSGSVYFDQVQVENAGSASAYESTGSILDEQQVNRWVDMQAAGRQMVPYELQLDPPILGTDGGAPAIICPAGRESAVSRRPMLGVQQDDWPAVAGGVSIGIVAKGTIQFGTNGRAAGLSEPWRVLFRDWTPTAIGFNIHTTSGVAIAAKSVPTTNNPVAAILTMDSGVEARLYVDGDVDNPEVVSIDELTNSNFIGSDPDTAKIYGAITDTAYKAIFELLGWQGVLSVAQVTQIFAALKNEPYGPQLSY